jgi:DNA-binding CsgD family transcriptional regulator
MSDVEAIVTTPRRRASSGRKRRHGPPPRPPTQLDLHLGERLRLLRIARGVSLEEMASLLGLTVHDVHAHERGLKRIPANRLVEYAETLEVRLSRFFADSAPQAL